LFVELLPPHAAMSAPTPHTPPASALRTAIRFFRIISTPTLRKENGGAGNIPAEMTVIKRRKRYARRRKVIATMTVKLRDRGIRPRVIGPAPVGLLAPFVVCGVPFVDLATGLARGARADTRGRSAID
jgi:hypothetical protein